MELVVVKRFVVERYYCPKCLGIVELETVKTWREELGEAGLYRCPVCGYEVVLPTPPTPTVMREIL